MIGVFCFFFGCDFIRKGLGISKIKMVVVGVLMKRSRILIEFKYDFYLGEFC